jgi:hypothetical protein
MTRASGIAGAFVVALALALTVIVTGPVVADVPDNGLPDNGPPDNGLPDNGLPDNGLPDNGNSPTALINTPLFFNATTHAFWVSNPFTAATIAIPGNPLADALRDPFTALVMSYQWQLCHPLGDDAAVRDAFGKPHTFYGRTGLCVLPNGHGWHVDQPLDSDTARWLSAAVITQVNGNQVHNRYSVRGPTSDPGLPGARGNQLTAMTASLTSHLYAFGTHAPVQALEACPPVPQSTGLASCGWKPHFVGTAPPFSIVRISADSHGVPMILQVNLGVHAANPGDLAALAVSGTGGTIDPSVQLTVPAGGTFNVQWAADPRPAIGIVPPTLSATQVYGMGPLRFPADEVFVFPNREMYATAMIFNLSASDSNIAPIPGITVQGFQPVANCEPRINSDGFRQFCDASLTDGCNLCTRIIPPVSTVVFPNAHMWLDSSWTNAPDYYTLRACASATFCVAKFEGLIETPYCGASDPHCLNAASKKVTDRCEVQSLDTDTASPLPYAGNPQKLRDAAQCHIGSGPDTGFGVTTFFPNYGTQGACWATGTNNPVCQYITRN